MCFVGHTFIVDVMLVLLLINPGISTVNEQIKYFEFVYCSHRLMDIAKKHLKAHYFWLHVLQG